MAIQMSSPSLQSSAPFSAAALTPAETMTGDVRGIISRVVSRARSQGRDYLGQCHAAAQAVMAVRPDLTPREAFDAVTRLRD